MRDKVGRLADVYLDEETGVPEWGLVTTGLFGGRDSFVPLTTAELGDPVRLSVTREEVESAPNLDDDGELSHLDETLTKEQIDVEREDASRR